MDISVYYQPIFLLVITIMTIYYSSLSKNFNYGGDGASLQNTSQITIWLVVFCVVIGFRPIAGNAFGDTGTYSSYFLSYINSAPPKIGEDEWVFSYLMYYFANTFGNVSIFYTFVSFVYVFSMFVFGKKLIRQKVPIAMIFCLGAFSFFSYATNGIRNGMACSLILLAISYAMDRNIRAYLIAGVIAFVAYHIHHSTALPIVCFVAANIYNKPKRIFSFWVFSILLSLVAGGTISNIFASLGFDDRMSHYLTEVEYDGQFSRTGFRWDFLLYSAMPIILGYVILMKKNLQNKNYQILLATYIFCNSFWVMIIRAPFSNRFAYLSWFLYPLVIAYPILTIDIWGTKQGSYVSKILLAHTGFTLFMFFLYH